MTTTVTMNAAVYGPVGLMAADSTQVLADDFAAELIHSKRATRVSAQDVGFVPVTAAAQPGGGFQLQAGGAPVSLPAGESIAEIAAEVLGQFPAVTNTKPRLALTDELAAFDSEDAAAAITATVGQMVHASHDDNTIVWLGESHIARGNEPMPADYSSMVLPLPTSTVFPALVNFQDRGITTYCMAAIGQRLRMIRNAGVGSNRTQHMRARLDADVLSLRPGHVAVLAGYSNIVNDDTLSTITADLTDIYERILQAGAKLIVFTTFPTQSIIDTPARLAVWSSLNRWIRNYARTTKGVRCVDVVPDMMDAAGALVPNIFSDAIHLNQKGAQLFARAFARSMLPWLPEAPVMLSSPLEVWTETNPTGNIVLNGLMAGTGGTNSGTGMSGTVATSWTHHLEYGTSATSVASKVARTDGKPGEWQQVAISAISSAAVRLQQTRSLAVGAYSIGNTLRCMFELQVDSSTTFRTLQVMAQVQNSSFADISVFVANKETTVSEVMPMQSAHLFQIPDFVVPAGTNHIVFKVIAYSVAGAITFRVGTVDVRKV